ncbi:MAG: integrase core domain-containing protein [Chloroflexota bacterium]|nr:integrase core domain-containing protein [Chloroflexota bacterium]
MTAEISWLIVLLLLAMGICAAWQHRHQLLTPSGAISALPQRHLRPHTPDHCPVCRQQAAGSTNHALVRPVVQPWREVKSRRGAPKRIPTDGFACPNRRCVYYHITDAQVHALVGDGVHGKYERIQTFRCQSCTTTFSARRDTPLYRIKTSSSRVGQVLTALAEGLDVAATGRVFGHRHATITAWLTRAGMPSAMLHDRWFDNLRLPHLQLDELRTRLRRRAQILWLWVAIDPVNKLIPVLHLGARTQASAHMFVHELRQRLAPGCLPLFMSDGLRLYFYALTAHFGQWVDGVGRRKQQWQVARGLMYAQVKKVYRHRKLTRVTHVLRCGTRMDLTSALQTLGLSGRINTAFVERVNLTVRQSVAALIRRTWATAQTAPQLLAHLEWWRAYYHFARPHASLRMALAQPIAREGRRLPQRYRHRTPAMAAGLTRRCWTVRDLLTIPLPPTSRGVG